MTNYQITVGFKACISIDVKADSEKEAKEVAMVKMGKAIDAIRKIKGVDVNDCNYKVDGVLDMDATWNMVQS